MRSFQHIAAQFMLMLVLATACQPALTPTPPPRSLWGDIITVAEAEQSSAPALWADTSRVVTGWIGSDDAGIHQDMRQWLGSSLSPITVLPLPPSHPYAQSWLTGSIGNLHLLWLDANDAGETQLFSALITAQFTVERGPIPMSESLALHYAAVSEPNGRAWVVWSGGLLSEPSLYLRSIDEAGRPQPSQHIALDADYPAMVRGSDGSIELFWIEAGQLLHAQLRNGVVSESKALAPTVYLGAGDRLHSLSAGLDDTQGYVFWNVTRASGVDETWVTSGLLDASAWAQPVPLKISIDPDSDVSTGFNTGPASAASWGESPLAWAAPLNAQYAVLPVAVQSPDGLSVVYFQDGQLIGYQNVVSGVQLIGAPALTADRNRHLYLAWSQPSPTAAAQLLLTSTQP